MSVDRPAQHDAQRDQAERDPSSSAETECFTPDGSRDVSDVVLADAITGAAPSLPTPPPPLAEQRPARGKAPMALLPGARVDDFEIVRLLGRGAFGHVYLARQLSLDRLVALKVSANRGSEGRTMARLEHQHIVQVFSEKVDADFNQRLLCMQLVPGIGLERLISTLHSRGTEASFSPEPTATGVWNHLRRWLGSKNLSQNRLGEGDSPIFPRRLGKIGTVPDGSGIGFKRETAASVSQSSVAVGSGLNDSHWTGAELLAIIDRSASLPAALDPAALHDREALAKMDAVEATAWFGGRLAEALDFAHHHGVLHRDIKPANILVNTYGQPMLADFNISSQPVGSEPGGEEMFGGTFIYMAPEHLDAFNPADPTGAEAVTSRSDLYSLGLVLQQLLEGRTSFPPPQRQAKLPDTLRTMADERRRRPAVPPGPPGARKTLQRTLVRCLEPDPSDRFASGAELAEQLDGCRRLRESERQLVAAATGPAILAPIMRRPFRWLIILALLPQVLGSLVNITYNSTQIVNELTYAQQQLFIHLVIGYNVIVYPAAILLFVRALWPVWRCWQALAGAELLADGQVEAARRQALRLPRWVALLTAAGWFPGALLFPLTIALWEPTLKFHLAAHFVASFCLSGLIALAYSMCGAQFVVLRVLYPAMWRNVRGFNETARRELSPMTARLGWLELLAGSIPLVAVLMLTLGGQTAHPSFPYVVSGLIVLGMIGWHFTSAVIRGLSQVVVVLTGSKA